MRISGLVKVKLNDSIVFGLASGSIKRVDERVSKTHRGVAVW